MINAVDSIAVNYALTGDVKYAKVVRKILLKFAERFPKYLLAAGYAYTEFADCDPHEAVRDLYNLPTKKITAVSEANPNSLFGGYFAATRLCTNGCDGDNLIFIVEAYDLTANAIDEDGAPIYTEEEKTTICKNALGEMALLGYYDDSLNNKAVTNQKGCLLTGIAIGNPTLVRFGMSGFKDAVDNWFLKDGSTSESQGYATKTMDGIYPTGAVMRNYSDPVFYKGEDKLVNYNINKYPKYDNAWQNLIWGQQGNNIYPPIADVGAGKRFDTDYLPYLFIAFLDHEVIRTYVVSRLSDLKTTTSSLFYLDPDFNESTVGPYIFPDKVYPYMSQSHIRTGTRGEKSTFILDANNYGKHHQMDSLNIYYWKDGYELLLDIGYLVDHPLGDMPDQTESHHTVLIDRANQRTEGRNGTVHRYVFHDNVKITQASSEAYAQSSIYNRTIVQIEKPSGASYIIDVFRANGGSRRDNVFHGPNNDYIIEPKPVFVEADDNRTKYENYIRLSFKGIGTTEISGLQLREKKQDET